jgi:hypothetical protein
MVGHCYLAGYDAFSKLSIGYIGRNGFRATVPAVVDQFALPATYEPRLTYMVTSSQYLREGIVWNHSLYEDAEPDPWLIFVVEDDRMWEVDLRKRTSRVVLESPGPISATQFTALKSTVDSLQTDGDATVVRKTPFRLTGANMAQDYAVFQAAPAPAEKDKPEYGTLMGVKASDKVVLYHPGTGNTREFMLPKQVPNKWIRAYWLAPEEMIFHYDNGYWSGGPIQHLMWINTAGEITREEDVKLAGWVPEPPRNKAWKASVALPVPVVWVVGMVLGAPLFCIQNYFADDYASALSLVGGVAWPPLVVVLAIAAVLTWLTLRLQRKYGRTSTGVWAVFVFLLGVPGFLAYWLEHRRPKMETCAQCGQVVPRDRDVCAACQSSFPPPAPVGTEIFA